ncbi:aminopeptidase P family N-terminal domain-containing protein [Subtercola sp. YIM 133946]|uniref:aminopeptidase P family N-terminal domain-containing protein n=1 Tax=Subtercola sp. YIM 133946 TaxID=3118909 RepID=UPI002F9293F5
MKRGLVVLDPAEIDDTEWTDRVDALQTQLGSVGVDVALIYNDVSRGDDIGYLTNLVIYWNEGVLAVPAKGRPTLLTKLSRRVFSWMQKTSVLEDLRSGRSFGDLVAGYVADSPAGTIGFVDADLWPAAVREEIISAVPGWTTRDLGPLVRNARSLPSEAEVDLLRAGATVLRRALDDATGPGLSAVQRLSTIDLVTRHGGFADALVRASDADGHSTIEVAGEYRHGWLLAGRTFGEAGWLTALNSAQKAALDTLRSGVSWPGAEAAALRALDEVPEGSVRSVRWISQADFATGGELVGPSPTPATGEVFGIVVEVISPTDVRSVLTDTVLLTERGVEELTGPDSEYVDGARDGDER